MEQQSTLMKLQAEIKALERDNRELRAENANKSVGGGGKENMNYTMNSNATNNTQNAQNTTQYVNNVTGVYGPATPALYRSLDEVAASATITALQGQLGLMQAQCKMLLTDGIKGGADVGGLSMNDLSVGGGRRGGGGGDEEGEVERLFASPGKKSGGKRRGGGGGGGNVPIDDDDHDGGGSFLSSAGKSVNRSVNRSADITSTGFHGNLWKARYGGTKMR
jgi:hypothetical protein